MSNRLFLEYRIEFDSRTNQELLRECAEQFQKVIFDLWDGQIDETSGPVPAPHDVTFELVMEAKESHNGK